MVSAIDTRQRLGELHASFLGNEEKPSDLEFDLSYTVDKTKIKKKNADNLPKKVCHNRLTTRQ